MVARALVEGARLAGLARAILTQPEAAWWFEPIDRGSQLWISQTKERPNPAAVVTPTGEPDSWERYAQKPRGGLHTSTGVDGTSSVLPTLAAGTSDYAVDVSLPVTFYRLQIAADARVFEVDGSRAWRSFCLSYPATGEDGRVVTNWAAAARDWDAVHTSLGGMLVAEQVRVDGAAGWTEHNGWDFEQTVWLRWGFTEATALGELTGYPDYPVALRQPAAFLLDGEKPWRRVISFAADSE